MFLFDPDLDRRAPFSLFLRWLSGFLLFCGAVLALAYVYQWLKVALL